MADDGKHSRQSSNVEPMGGGTVGQIEGARDLSHAQAHLGAPIQPDTRDSAPHIAGYAAAAGIFAASRLIVLFAILFSVRFIPPNHLPGAWNEGATIWHYLLRWDSGWYLAIMRGGYHYVPDSSVQQPVNFFPLYPILSWCVASIFQCSFPTAALLVSNVASLAAALLLYQYVLEHRGAQIAFFVVALFSFFPASIFLSAGYPESLAMALTMAAFLDLGRARYIRAAFWCGLLSAARPTGIVMLAPLAYCLWPRRGWTRAAAIRLVLGLGTGCSGLAAYAIYLGLKFNAPFVFATSQNHWIPGEHWSPIAALYAFGSLANLFRGIPLPSTLDPWLSVAFAVVIFAMRSELSYPELVFAAATFGFLAVTRLCVGTAFGSFGRYLMAVFPAYIATAKLLEKRPLLIAGVCMWMAIGLFWYTALFAQWHWVE